MADQGKKKSTSDSSKKDEDKPSPKKAAAVNPAPVYVGGDSLADRLMPHVKKIAIAIAAVGIVLTAYFTWRWMQTKKAQSNTTPVLTAVNDQAKEVEAPDEATDTGDAGVPADDTYATRQERAEAVVTDLQKAKGPPREGAALLEASSQLEAGHLDE